MSERLKTWREWLRPGGFVQGGVLERDDGVKEAAYARLSDGDWDSPQREELIRKYGKDFMDRISQAKPGDIVDAPPGVEVNFEDFVPAEKEPTEDEVAALIREAVANLNDVSRVAGARGIEFEIDAMMHDWNRNCIVYSVNIKKRL